jgi:hypothetical protein
MPRYANYPTTVEDSLTFRLKSLTENNNTYLTSYGTRKGVTSWSRNGIVDSKIDIKVTHSEYNTYIILNYKYNGEPINYRVNLISKPSNLGKGKIWFFICPRTGKYCRKLHLQRGYFLHREAFKNLMYANQIISKNNRAMHSIFDKAYLKDEVYKELYSKHFRTHYNGKETKRYKRIMDKINISESYSRNTLESLLMM